MYLTNDYNQRVNAPDGAIPCWYVDDREKSSAIVENRQFCSYYTTSEYFRIINCPDPYHLEGYLGRVGREPIYFERFDYGLTYFIDYRDRKNIYFTFDKTTLYRVAALIPDKPFRFSLQQINNHTMQNQPNDQITYQTIINARDGNTITTGNHNIISVVADIKGNQDALRKTLVDHKVPANDIQELVDIIQIEQPSSTGQLGAKADSWVRKMVQKSLDGTWEIGIATAGGLLTEILKSFFGIK